MGQKQLVSQPTNVKEPWGISSHSVDSQLIKITKKTIVPFSSVM
jgi:hypothetical protein